VGRAAGGRFGVEFLDVDLRDRYHESCERARGLGLYRQNYCGCLFSDLERSERRASRALAKAAKERTTGRAGA
jgi:predicted adenine nucleotide alpha hydrolase (AANH) superfamily ATPase